MKKTQGENRLIVCLVLLFVISGCGLKANPVPIQHISDYRLIVKDMQAIPADDAVMLKWNFQDTDGKINFINIEKSEVGTAGNECKDCPRTFERINQMQIKGTVLDNKVSSALSYTDKKVVKGKIYNYRLILCDDAGSCQDASAAEIDYK
ncbi:MAG: hypothetical protein WCO53_06000 [Deltaproteobacteria bacterium]